MASGDLVSPPPPRVSGPCGALQRENERLASSVDLLATAISNNSWCPGQTALYWLMGA